jgi:predicted acyl esterase
MRARIVIAAAYLGLATLSLSAQPAPAPTPSEAAAPFTFHEVMVPMRDGAKLQTVIIAPSEAMGPLPILFQRTP